MLIGIDIRTAIGQKVGIGIYNYNLVINLAKIDTNNRYILYSDKPLDFGIDNKNFQIKVFQYPKFLWHFRVLLDIIFNQVDIYHTSSMIIPSFLRDRCSVFFPDITNFLFPQYHTLKLKIARIFFKKAIKNSKIIFTISLNSKKDIVSFFNTSESKIMAIYLAASEKFKRIENKSELKSIKSKYNLPDKFILFVGSIEPRKNLTGLIKAFQKIKTKIEHKLVIVGGKGWLNSEIYKMIKKEKLQDDIIFTGYVSEEDLVAIYNLADLFVYPSFYEGFGIPVLEAMSCGCPVITSNTSSLPEVCGDAGIMVDPYNVDQLAQMMLKAIQDVRLHTQMVMKGFQQVKNFSWQETASQTLLLLEKIVVK